MKKIWISESLAIVASITLMLLSGLIFNHWLFSVILTLSAYIIWLYYRLLKLEKWLVRGTKASEVYDDPGFIGHIIRHLYKQKKVHNKRKKRTKDILRRLNQNISALPDATVLLNEQLEIEWSNLPAHYLLGINNRFDKGQRIGNLIRHPNFLRYLISPDDKDQLEIESHIDQNIILQIKVVRFGKNQRLLTARNISEQKQLQEALKNFVANASHELKTPLTVISGHLEMLENESGLSEQGRKSVSEAQKQSQRMTQLIQDLLLLSRVESYQLQPNEGDTVSINDVMTNTMSALGKSCNQQPLTCVIKQDLYLRGIKPEIEGICINLISNAIKYSAENVPVHISWSVNKLGETVFSVSDQGSGISDSDLRHITDRYFRGSSATTKQVNGSGLGLAIVEQAACKHGASLEFHSQLNRGSTFTVTFPSYRVIDKSSKPINLASLKAL